MDHLEACVELTFAVFPESSAFFQPSEGPFHDPPFGDDGEGLQVAAFRDLDGGIELFLDRVGERLAGVAAVDQHADDVLEVGRAAVEGGQGAIAVGHVGGRDGDRVRQALRVDRDVALDAGDLLARVIALPAGRVGVLHALRVHDQEAGQALAPLFDAGLANRFFLAPAPGR